MSKQAGLGANPAAAFTITAAKNPSPRDRAFSAEVPAASAQKCVNYKNLKRISDSKKLKRALAEHLRSETGTPVGRFTPDGNAIRPQVPCTDYQCGDCTLRLHNRACH